ncbi:MAG: hypothetical protein KGZ39_00085 [Simkania sp.]|nr:hypothetical protein [Simkania sp.]
MLPLIFFLIAIVAAIIHLNCRKKSRSSSKLLELFLAYMIPLNIGIMSLIGWIAHSFYGPQTAAMMGWPDSPFQHLLGMANLGFGLVGILSIWQRKGFWLSTIISYAVFALGCAHGHLMHAATFEYKMHWHHGFLLFINCFFIPIVLLILSIIYSKQNKFFKN